MEIFFIKNEFGDFLLGDHCRRAFFTSDVECAASFRSKASALKTFKYLNLDPKTCKVV